MSKSLAGKLPWLPGARVASAPRSPSRWPPTAPTSPSAIRHRPTRPRTSSTISWPRASAPHAFQADQANPSEVEALVKSVVDLFGRLDILVNNAGISGRNGAEHATDNVSAVERLFDVNVAGVAAAVRAAEPHL